MKWLRVGGLVMLIASAVIVVALSLRSRSPSSAGPAASSGTHKLGEAPPEDVARNPVAAKEFVESQNCLANCTAEARTCSATAEGDEAVARCQAEAKTCEAGCQPAGN
jgi:hypothetical protein